MAAVANEQLKEMKRLLARPRRSPDLLAAPPDAKWSERLEIDRCAVDTVADVDGRRARRRMKRLQMAAQAARVLADDGIRDGATQHRPPGPSVLRGEERRALKDGVV